MVASYGVPGAVILRFFLYMSNMSMIPLSFVLTFSFSMNVFHVHHDTYQSHRQL